MSFVSVQDEVAVEDVCKEIIKQWTDYSSQSKAKNDSDDGIQLLITFLQYPFSLATYAIARWKELFEVTRMELCRHCQWNFKKNRQNCHQMAKV